MLFSGVCVWIVVYGYWCASYYPPISFEAGVLVLLPKAPFSIAICLRHGLLWPKS